MSKLALPNAQSDLVLPETTLIAPAWQRFFQQLLLWTVPQGGAVLFQGASAPAGWTVVTTGVSPASGWIWIQKA